MTLECIPQAITTLRGPVKTEGLKSHDIRFHINTKFAHLLVAWKSALENGAEGAGFSTWCSLASDFVGALPKHVTAIDGVTQSPVDPFSGVREVFRTNKIVDPATIPDIVKEMLAVSKASGLQYSNQDHGNLVELSTMYGLVSQDAERKFFKNVLNTTTPTQDLEELAAEWNVLDALGEAEVIPLKNGSLVRHVQGAGCVYDSVAGKELVLNGFGGCLCRFPICEEDNNVVVIQPSGHVGTSVTNLAEAVYSAICKYNPSAKVFEIYEYSLQEGSNELSEIVMDGGCAGWKYTESESLVNLAKDRLGLSGPDVA